MDDIKKYYFSKSIAKNIGVEEAIMFSNIYFWVNLNQKKHTNFHEGKYWTFNSVTSLAEQYPFWTVSQIRRILTNLEKEMYIQTGRFNRYGYDKTKWYTVTKFALQIIRTDKDFVQISKSIEEL